MRILDIVSMDVLIITLMGAVITWYFGVLLRNKETRNKASESFIKNKIAAYDAIREYIACFLERDFAGSSAKCRVKKEFPKLEISFSKVLACREQLHRKSVEIHCAVIMKHQFFIEPRLLKKLLSLREALYRLHCLYQRKDYNKKYNNDIKVAFLVTQGIVALCKDISRDLFKFYSRPKFLRFGKMISEKEEARNKLQEDSYWERAESTIAYLCKNPVSKWNNDAYKAEFGKDNEALLSLDKCRCGDKCWKKKKEEYCNCPPQLETQSQEDEEEKKYLLNVKKL